MNELSLPNKSLKRHILFSDGSFEEERQWIANLRDKNIPTVFVLNKSDIVDSNNLSLAIETEFGKKPICVSALHKENIDTLLKQLQTISTGLEKE